MQSPSDASSEAAALSAELEINLLHELSNEWYRVNVEHFGSSLRMPQLSLSDSRTFLGRWRGDPPAIEMSRSFVLEQPWGEVVEVLKHEIAHQFVAERLAPNEPPHGHAFRATCQRLGIDAAARARPADPDQPAELSAEDRVVRKIRKLLALAESPNQHEAEAAAATARALMLEFNIASERTSAPRHFHFRHLGTPRGRIFEHQRWLANILRDYYFVDVIFVSVYVPLQGKRGTVLEICGTDTNLVMAEYVHGFLEHTAARLWESYREQHGIRSNRDRLTFLAGVMRGFADKLSVEKSASNKRGLIWVPKGDLGDYMRQRHPRICSIRRAGQRRNEAYVAGKSAGGNIVVSRPVGGGSSSGVRGLLRE